MHVIVKNLPGSGRNNSITLYPLFDVHLGAAACDEEKFAATIERIEQDEDAYWVGGGDMCEWINVKDHRFDPRSYADWIQLADLRDLSQVQKLRFLDYVRPIAGKCLGMLTGNHEEKIARVFERDIYREILVGVKEQAGMDPLEPLALGYSGWLVLRFSRTASSRAAVKIRLHHGWGGGRKPGSKANRMQDFLYQNDCDLALMGHTHDLTPCDPVIVESVGHQGGVNQQVRKGVWCGSFLRNNVHRGAEEHEYTTYSERAGYSPKATGCPIITIRPFAEMHERIKVTT